MRITPHPEESRGNPDLQEGVMPWILIVYDAQTDVAYWLYVQAYFEQLTISDLPQTGETVTVYLSKQNILDQEAIRTFARYRDIVLQQLQGVIHHDV
ncbi:DUF4365 domain-containing protein [Phormidesmis sp. 146-12]